MSINTLSSLPDTVRSFGRAGSSSHRLEGAFSETDGNDYPNSCESSAEDIDPCSRAPLASDTVLGCKGAQDRSGVDGADGSEPAGATDIWPRAPSLDIVAAAAAAHLAGGDDSAPRAPLRPTRIRRHSEPVAAPPLTHWSLDIVAAAAAAHLAGDDDSAPRAPLAADTVLGCKGAQDRSGVDGADGSEPAGATDSWPRAPSLDIVAAAAAAHLAGGDDSAPRAPPRPTRIRRHSEPLTQGSSDAARSRNRSKE